MTKEALREAMMKAPRQAVTLVLSSGGHVPVKHPDYVMFSPDTPELIAYGERGSFKVVALSEIASIDVGPLPKSSS